MSIAQIEIDLRAAKREARRLQREYNDALNSPETIKADYEGKYFRFESENNVNYTKVLSVEAGVVKYESIDTDRSIGSLTQGQYKVLDVEITQAEYEAQVNTFFSED